jgi:signal transduction histidine kinase
LDFNDNGAGIPRENLQRVFDAFYSTKPDNGTGIGLAMAKKIIEMYDGEISVSSDHGKGTTFSLKLKPA